MVEHADRILESRARPRTRRAGPSGARARRWLHFRERQERPVPAVAVGDAQFRPPAGGRPLPRPRGARLTEAAKAADGSEGGGSLQWQPTVSRLARHGPPRVPRPRARPAHVGGRDRGPRDRAARPHCGDQAAHGALPPHRPSCLENRYPWKRIGGSNPLPSAFMRAETRYPCGFGRLVRPADKSGRFLDVLLSPQSPIRRARKMTRSRGPRRGARPAGHRTRRARGARPPLVARRAA